VFLTSVHLRILDTDALAQATYHQLMAMESTKKHKGGSVVGVSSSSSALAKGTGVGGLALAASSSPERRELALESLLDFCREPALMLVGKIISCLCLHIAETSVIRACVYMTKESIRVCTTSLVVLVFW